MLDLPILTTERLTLRPLILADVPALHAWLSDPAGMRFWSTLPHTDIKQTEDWVRVSLDAMAKGEAQDFAVLHAGEIIGRIAFWQGNEIGFFFDPARQGQGFAGEALRAISQFGFDTLNFATIEADVDPDNTPSLRLLERNGFERTGFAEKTFEIGGKWFDSVYLSLRKGDLR